MSAIHHDERYLALVAQYIASLPAKVAALSHAITRARGGDAEALQEARSIAHRLRGTAGCYGLHPLSAAAAVLDEELSAFVRGERTDWRVVDAAYFEVSATSSSFAPST